jgi:transcriptional regulator with XRE-family HTH domain
VTVSVENVKRVQKLRAQGLLQREIAERTGLSRSTVSQALTDPTGEKERVRRRKRYGGTCIDCGGPTRYGGTRVPPKRCKPCERAFRHTDASREERTLWTRERILTAIKTWAEEYGEPPASQDWNPWACRYELHDEERALRAERLISEGVIPWMTLVVNRFGSWNAGLIAAGFKPRANHGGAGNQLRRRKTAA